MMDASKRRRPLDESVKARPEVIAMSALRAHGSERTEGIGSTRLLSGEATEGRVRAEVTATAEAYQGAPGALASAPGTDAPSLQPQCLDLDSVVPHSVSGVAERGAVRAGNALPRRSGERSPSGEQSRPSNARAQSFHRYLSAQSDIDEEVIRLYKLVCRV